MSKNTNTTTTYKTSGAGFFTLLAILFIGLKLTGFIDWSWWIVLLPLYAGPAFALCLVAVVLIIAAIFK